MEQNMNSVLTQVLDLLSSDKLLVKSQGIDVILQYLNEEYYDLYLEKNLIGKLINMLTIPNLVHKVQIVLLNLSSIEKFLNAFLKSNIINKEIALIHNIMKQLKEEDLTIMKSLLKNLEGKQIGEGLIEMEINDTDKVNSKELIPMLNLDNLRFGILIINNLISLSDEFKIIFMKLDEKNEELQACDFYIFLDWFIDPKLTNIFSYFSMMLINLTSFSKTREFIIKKNKNILNRISYILEESKPNKRMDILKSMRNLSFMYENQEFIKTTIENGFLKNFYKYYKNLITLKKNPFQNSLSVNINEEISCAIEIFLVFTNINFKEIDIDFKEIFTLEELEIFKEKELVSEENSDKLDVITAIFESNIN